MATYNGPAVVISNDGTEYPVTTTLTTSTNGYLTGWNGQLAVPLATFQDLLGQDDGRIRLQNGSEGRIQFGESSTDMTQESSVTHIEIFGSGDAPF